MKKILFALLATSLLTNCTPAPSDLVFNDSVARNIATAYLDYDTSPFVTDRAYVESVMDQVFGTSANTDGVEAAVFQKKEFGGGCDRYAASDIGSSTTEFPRSRCFTGIGSVQPANSNPMRYSYTAKTCESLINTTARFNYAMKLIYPTWTSGAFAAPNAESIQKAYQLFLPADTATDDVISAFLTLSTGSTSTTDAWKRILTTLCVSPEWQVF